MTVVEYINVSANSSDKLVALVNEKIKEGWQPIGGVFVTSLYTAVYLQAMVKYA